MSRLVWGAPGERFFEAGTDRGVLYLGDEPGSPWNGIVSVQESPTGGEPQPYFIEGQKYLNLMTGEDFAATLTAFSAPEAFNACDGTQHIHTGLFITQQPRKKFDLTYRTLVGNDIQGTDYGYKIHLVYNALASASERANTTLGSSVTPMQKSWAISTVPPKISGYRPTAHFVVDTRWTPTYIMAELENVLYGFDGGIANMPTVEELLAIFGMEPPEDVFTEEFGGTF